MSDREEFEKVLRDVGARGGARIVVSPGQEEFAKLLRDVGVSGAVRKVRRDPGFRFRVTKQSDAEKRAEIVEGRKAFLRSWCDGVAGMEELAALRRLILERLDSPSIRLDGEEPEVVP